MSERRCGVWFKAEGCILPHRHDGAHRNATQQQLERLMEALLKYGAHTGMCGYDGGPGSNPKTGYRCVCGLYDIVDEDAFTARLDP